MKKILLVATVISVMAFATEAYCTEYINENWDSGTPAACWPCKTFPSAVCGTSFNGWQGMQHDYTEEPPNQAGISATQSYSGTNSFYAYRGGSQSWACDITHALSEPYPNTIYVRFYIYFTTNWSSVNNLNTHFLFFNSALSYSSFRLNFEGYGSYSCAGHPFVLMPQGAGGETWSWNNHDGWADGNAGDPVCQVNYGDFVGQWKCIEYKLQASTESPYDVTLTEYIDGVQTRGPITGPGLGASYGPGWRSLIISGFDSPGISQTTDFYIDDLVVSDSYIGPSGSSTPARKLNNVTGVRVTLH